MQPNLSTLIQRLEEADGPSRELDAEIAISLVPDSRSIADKDCERGCYWEQLSFGQSLRTSPEFTASIDAALTLVPEGWTRDVDATAPECGIDVALHPPVGEPAVGTHTDEAIATCIAALKAHALRAQQQGEG